MRTNNGDRMIRYTTASEYKKADGTRATRSKAKYCYMSRHFRRNHRRKLIKSGIV